MIRFLARKEDMAAQHICELALPGQFIILHKYRSRVITPGYLLLKRHMVGDLLGKLLTKMMIGYRSYVSYMDTFNLEVTHLLPLLI